MYTATNQREVTFRIGSDSSFLDPSQGLFLRFKVTETSGATNTMALPAYACWSKVVLRCEEELCAEEIAILGNFTCAVNTRADGQRLAQRLIAVGKAYAPIYSDAHRIRLYWCSQPADACILLCAFRDVGGAAALYRDLVNTGEYVVWRRSGQEPVRSCCGVS